LSLGGFNLDDLHAAVRSAGLAQVMTTLQLTTLRTRLYSGGERERVVRTAHVTTPT